jgi:hypothetical protein
MSSVLITPKLKGTVIGGKGPSAICVPASACLPSVEALKLAGIANPADLDHGIQGQYLTRPGDTLVVKGRPKIPPNRIMALVSRGMQLTAELWKAQTGIELVSPQVSGDHASLTPTEGAMMSQAARVIGERGLKLTIPAPFSAIVEPLPAYIKQNLQAEVYSHELLASKNSAIPFFAKHGLPVPHTVCINSKTDLENLSTEQLIPEKRYVIKFDGVAGGIGVDTNSGTGFCASAVVTKVKSLGAEGKLPQNLQLQEFIAGKTIGAVALFRSDGSFKVASIHRMVEIPSGLGIEWQPGLEQLLKPQVVRLFSKLASIDELKLLGPVGLDMQYDGEKLTIIECNPRLTGASPFGLIRAKVAKTNLKLAQRIGHMFIDTCVSIPEEAFGDIRRMRGVFDSALSKHPEALCLPQGLSPFDGSKLIFVNDSSGALRDEIVTKLRSLGKGK